MRYENHYGTVELEPVTDYMPIADISYHLTAAQDNAFSLEMAEQVALITENRGIQIAFPVISGKYTCAYVVLHQGANHAAICRVTNLTFLPTRSARECLEEEHRIRTLGANTAFDQGGFSRPFDHAITSPSGVN